MPPDAAQIQGKLYSKIRAHMQQKQADSKSLLMASREADVNSAVSLLLEKKATPGWGAEGLPPPSANLR